MYRLPIATRTWHNNARSAPTRNAVTVCAAVATSTKLDQLHAYEVPTSLRDVTLPAEHQWLQHQARGLEHGLDQALPLEGTSLAAPVNGPRHPFLRWLRTRGHPLPHNARCGCQEACTHQHGVVSDVAKVLHVGRFSGGLAEELAAEGMQVAIIDTSDAAFQCQASSQSASLPNDSAQMPDTPMMMHSPLLAERIEAQAPDGKAVDSPFDFLVLYGLSLPDIGSLRQLRTMLHPFGALCCEVLLERCSRSHTPAAAVASVINLLHDAGMTVTSWELLSGVPSSGAAAAGGRLRLVAVQAF